MILSAQAKAINASPENMERIQGKINKPPHTRTKVTGFTAAFFYGLCSITLTLLNKTIMSYFQYNFPMMILGLQMLFAIFILEILMYFGFVDIPKVSFQRLSLISATSLFYALNACMSLVALEGMNLPMYSAIKRCGPAVNLLLATFVLHKPLPSRQLIISISLVTSGALIAGLHDPAFSEFSYLMAGISVFVQCMFQTLVQKSAEDNFSALEILHLNGYNSVLPFFVLSYFYEANGIMQFQQYLDLQFQVSLSSLILMGIVLNFSSFLCTSLNSALTTSIVGVIKGILITVIGYFSFGGVQFNMLNFIGLCLNTLGGMGYIWSKYTSHQVT